MQRAGRFFSNLSTSINYYTYHTLFQIRAQNAEDEVRTLRTLLMAHEQGIDFSNRIIPADLSVAEQIRHGTRNAEILLK